MLRSVYHLMTCEQMMKEKRRDIVNDSMQALHALAKLMPLLNSQCSLSEMLGTINRVLGSTLAWVSVDDDDGLQRVVCAGDVTCHSFEVTDFLASTTLQRHHRSWRVVYWKEHIGRALFPLSTRATRNYKAVFYANSLHTTGTVAAISFWRLMNDSILCRSLKISWWCWLRN
jgi:hypothetical protein